MSLDIACPQCDHLYHGIDRRLVGQSFTCACGCAVHITEDALHRPAHITVVCPACSHEFVGMEPSLAGQTFNCICGRQLKIEAAPTPAAPIAHNARDATDPPKPAAPDANKPAPTHHAPPPAAAHHAPHAPAPNRRHVAVATGMLQVVCPTCEHLYHSIPPEYAGRRFKCQTCDTSVPIPAPPPPEGAPPEVAHRAAAAPPAAAPARAAEQHAVKLDYLSLATFEEEDAAILNRGDDDHAPPTGNRFDYEQAEPQPSAAGPDPLLLTLVAIAAALALILAVSFFILVMASGGE